VSVAMRGSADRSPSSSAGRTGSLDTRSIAPASCGGWRARIAGARRGDRPGSSRPSSRLASRPAEARCPGRPRGTAACRLMKLLVWSSPAPRAHPPRSNPFLRSSSDAPPFPCTTPSRVICVMVVSFMIADPSS
jgi:hypothetical protein